MAQEEKVLLSKVDTSALLLHNKLKQRCEVEKEFKLSQMTD